MNFPKCLKCHRITILGSKKKNIPVSTIKNLLCNGNVPWMLKVLHGTSDGNKITLFLECVVPTVFFKSVAAVFASHLDYFVKLMNNKTFNQLKPKKSSFSVVSAISTHLNRVAYSCFSILTHNNIRMIECTSPVQWINTSDSVS